MANRPEEAIEKVEVLVSKYVQRKSYGVQRRQILSKLVELGELAVEPLVKELRTAPDPMDRAEAAKALGIIGRPSAADALIEALQKDQGSDLSRVKLHYWKSRAKYQVRVAAVAALVQLRDATMVEPLIDALQGDTHSEVRRLAAVHLGKLGDQAAAKPLTQAILSDRAIIVRQAAIPSLVQLVDFAAFEPVAKALRSDKHPTVRLEAARALEQLGHPGSVEALAKALLSDTDSKVRLCVATVLAELGDRAAAKAFVTALAHDDSTEVRRIVVHALGKIGGITVEPFVRALQNDEDAIVCSEAARALGRLGDPAATEPLTYAIQSANTEVREAASAALYAISNIPPPPAFIRSIEFPPEYTAVGMSILHHFREILRSKYSDIEPRVTITQHDRTVTMIIETDDGDQLDRIEKTFEDYGLVIQGEIPVDDFLDERGAILRLENRIGLLEHELRMEQRISAYLEGDLAYHKRLLSEAIRGKSTTVYVNAHAGASATAFPTIQITQRIAGLQGSLAELAQSLPTGSEERITVQEISEELDALPEDPGEAKKLPVLARLRRFVEELGDDKSRLGKSVRGLKAGGRIVQDVGRFYNDVAQWVGLPQVPQPLLGRGKDDK